jgi:hypothetical protein
MAEYGLPDDGPVTRRALIRRLLSENVVPSPEPFTWRDTWPGRIAADVGHALGMYQRAAPPWMGGRGERIPIEEAVRGSATIAGMLMGGAPAAAQRGAVGAVGGRLPMDEASRMARARQLGYDETPFYRGEASGRLPDEYPGGAHFSRDRDEAMGFARRGGKAEPREFRLTLGKAFDDNAPLTGAAYANLVRAAQRHDPKLADDLVASVAPVGRDAEWLLKWAETNPDQIVVERGRTIRPWIEGIRAPEHMLRDAGYDAVDSGRDVRKITGDGIRLKDAEFDPEKAHLQRIMAALLLGLPVAPAVLGAADPGRE